MNNIYLTFKDVSRRRKSVTWILLSVDNVRSYTEFRLLCSPKQARQILWKSYSCLSCSIISLCILFKKTYVFSLILTSSHYLNLPLTLSFYFLIALFCKALLFVNLLDSWQFWLLDEVRKFLLFRQPTLHKWETCSTLNLPKMKE